ncbi:cell division protein FtsQ/DivIB [Thiolapillus brandeum]|uniref:Cell division protein FtsQ n=1 Tax=Thiolapillus brandeum TaxID=1076588 RepID=A0A7U6JH64_9GAMM|nr:cell division protein FtsQ/DivIB [Thiolapillus brandeum]BAO43507.1 cell division protein FtsQ [Thiolapillus brandeum]
MKAGARRQNVVFRHWRLLGLLGFALVLVAGGWGLARYLMDPHTLPIRAIQVKGEFRNLDRENVEQVLAKAVDGGFFSLDLGHLRDAVMASPWVADARITRVWPDRLVVDVTEEQAIARWGDDGLLNKQGEVFHPRKRLNKPLPLSFRGDESKAPVMLDFFVREQPGFRQHGMAIRAVTLDKRGEWRLELVDGTRIVIGKENMHARIRRLLGAYPVLEQEPRRPQTVDLRYEQGFAVSWRPEEQS